MEQVLGELADSYLEMQNLDKAATALERQRNLLEDPVVKLELTDHLVEVLLEKQDRVGAVNNLLAARKWAVDGEEKDDLRYRIAEVILQCPSEDLKKLVKLHRRDFPADLALIRLAELEEAKGYLFEAERELRRFLDFFPKHPEEKQVHSRLKGIKNQLLEFRFLIGVMLPMSERFNPFALQVLKGIRLAVDRFDPPLDQDIEQ